MNRSNVLYFEISPWWIIPMIILFALGVWYLYSARKMPWNRTTSYLLGVVRLVALTAIALLLLNPFLNLITNRLEKPNVVIMVDNSSSMLHHHDSTEIVETVNEMTEELNQLGYTTSIYDLDGVSDSLEFNSKSTDITRALRMIQKEFKGQNLGRIILLSDGINNRGFSPLYYTSLSPIFTIGFGDTIPPKDIGIVEARYNNIVYKGNQFPVEVLIATEGYEEESTIIRILKQGETVAQTTIQLDKDQTVRFFLNATEAGLSRYQIILESLEGEEQPANNQYDFYVDVIEGKEKVLIAAPAPHPDIRAIRDALQQESNYETHLYIPGISELPQDELFDVAIFHQALSRNFPTVDIKDNIPIWYIIDPQGRIGQAATFSGVSIRQSRSELDAVGPYYNASFSRFSMDEGFEDVLTSYPSLQVPYGDYAINGPVEVLLYQRIGSVVTSRPLLSFFDDGNRKSALLTGTGLWKWKLQEAAIEGEATFFNQIITKTVQLLSIKADKRQFRISPTRRVFNEGERIRFSIETYNSIYERTGGNSIELTIRNEEGTAFSYSFTSDLSNNVFSTGYLPPGIYTYTASTRIGEKTVREDGEFLVNTLQLEKLDRVANHQLLKEIARNSEGNYYSYLSLSDLQEDIREWNLSGVLKSQQNYMPLINLVWILVIVILLMSVEWFFRKYLGGY